MRISEDRMKELAGYVCRMIRQGEGERSEMDDSWSQSKNDYENQAYPYISQIVNGAQDIPFPFAFTRAEALSDHVVTSITNQSPLVQLELDGGDETQESAENRQRTMDRILRRADFEERLKSISGSVWWANCGILRVSPGSGMEPIRIDAVSPEDFVIVGSASYDVDDSLMVGHKFQRTRSDIERMQKAGRYSKDVEVSDLPQEGHTLADTGETPKDSESHGSDLITLYQVYPYLDPKSWDEMHDEPMVTANERRFSIVIEPETESILRIEEYTLKTPCYFVFRYKARPVKGFWHKRPLGADMQGPHRQYQCLGNLALYGAAMSAMPPLVAQKGAFSRDQRYGPGKFVNMESGDAVAPTVQFDLGKVQAELQRIERIGDGVARINAAGAGMESIQNKTATQSNNEMAGMMAGIGGFLETYTTAIPAMCEHIEEILSATFDEWKPAFGDQLPVESVEEFSIPGRWDVPGKIPNLNPSAVVNNLQTLLGVLSQAVPLVQAMGPHGAEIAKGLMESAMNAMDWPNKEPILQAFEAMGQPQPQPPTGMEMILGGQADPGMGGPATGQPPMGTPMQGVPAEDYGAYGPMPEALPY